MAKNDPQLPATSASKVKQIRAGDPADLTGRLKVVGGSKSDSWNSALADQAVRALSTKHSDNATVDEQYQATLGALMGIAPRDELEGMMATQLIAAHNAAMERHRRVMLPEQTLEGRKLALEQANKLSRTWATLLNALNTHRGKGQQKVTVEHLHVYAGGKAVVGTVERPAAQRPPGGGATEDAGE